MGRFNPEEHPDFEQIDSIYADRSGLFLHKEAYSAFIRMWNHAKDDGVNLVIRSATRNFDYQKGIWERKWMGQTRLEIGVHANEIENETERSLAILRYSSMPGSSRHHWGTDIDLNAFTNEYFGDGEGLVIYNWLINHAREYGFCQPYTAFDERRTSGYQEEKWHWSYFPISATLTNIAAKSLEDEMIQGFQGDQTAKDINIVKQYVLGINPECFK